MATAPALGKAPELRAIKWRHLTFATGQTAAAIGYTLDALSPNAPLLSPWLRRSQAAFYMAGGVISATWWLCIILLRGTAYGRVHGHLFSCSSVLSTLYSASFFYLPVRSKPAPSNFYLMRMAVFSLLPTIAGRHAEHAVPVALGITIPVHLVLDAAWQYQLCSGSSIYPNPAGMDGDQGCARLPSLLGLLLGRMLPAVVILLFVLFSLTLVCEDQRDQVVELGAAAVAAREQEAWQAAMGTANGRSSGSGLGNSTSTVDSFRQRRGLGAGLQALWQLPDDFMRLLWRVRFSVKALWHHTLSEDVIKCALWPLMAVVVSLQILRMSTNSTSSPLEVLLGMALGMFMGHVEGKDISQVMFSQLTAMTRLAHDLVPSHVAQMLVQQQMDDSSSQQAAAQHQDAIQQQLSWRHGTSSVSDGVQDQRPSGPGVGMTPAHSLGGMWQASGMGRVSHDNHAATVEEWEDEAGGLWAADDGEAAWAGRHAGTLDEYEEDEEAGVVDERLQALLQTVLEGRESTYADSGPTAKMQQDSPQPPLVFTGSMIASAEPPTAAAPLLSASCPSGLFQEGERASALTGAPSRLASTRPLGMDPGGEQALSSAGRAEVLLAARALAASQSFSGIARAGSVLQGSASPRRVRQSKRSVSFSGIATTGSVAGRPTPVGARGAGSGSGVEGVAGTYGSMPWGSGEVRGPMPWPPGPPAYVPVLPLASRLQEQEEAGEGDWAQTHGRCAVCGAAQGSGSDGSAASLERALSSGAGHRRYNSQTVQYDGSTLSPAGRLGAALERASSSSAAMEQSNSLAAGLVPQELTPSQGQGLSTVSQLANLPSVLLAATERGQTGRGILRHLGHSCSGYLQSNLSGGPSTPMSNATSSSSQGPATQGAALVPSLNWQGLLGMALTPRRRSDVGAMLQPQRPRTYDGQGGAGPTTAPQVGAGGDGGAAAAAPQRLLAFSHEAVTILFADIVGFTSLSKALQPYQVFEFLNQLYARYDSQVDRYRVYKVETIGDCYMCATGLMSNDPEHAAQMLRFAQEMQRQAAHVQMPDGSGPVRIRIGIHSGPVLSGVIGRIRKRYCVVGSTVNIASRMESTGVPGRVHVSGDAHALVQHLDREFQWECRGQVAVKGAGDMVTYLLH